MHFQNIACSISSYLELVIMGSRWRLILYAMPICKSFYVVNVTFFRPGVIKWKIVDKLCLKSLIIQSKRSISLSMTLTSFSFVPPLIWQIAWYGGWAVLYGPLWVVPSGPGDRLRQPNGMPWPTGAVFTWQCGKPSSSLQHLEHTLLYRW